MKKHWKEEWKLFSKSDIPENIIKCEATKCKPHIYYSI